MTYSEQWAEKTITSTRMFCKDVIINWTKKVNVFGKKKVKFVEGLGARDGDRTGEGVEMLGARVEMLGEGVEIVGEAFGTGVEMVGAFVQSYVKSGAMPVKLYLLLK